MHLGFGDKILTKFIIDLGWNCNRIDQFDAKLKEYDVEMPDYFVRTLLTVIHTILHLKPQLEKRHRRDRRRNRYGKDERPRDRDTDENVVDNRDKNRRHQSNEPELYKPQLEKRHRRDRRRNRYGKDERPRDRDTDENVVDNRDKNRRHQSNEPELYKVYKGRVSRVMDTGCFVQLTDLKGKEGLVHVSQIATRRIVNVGDINAGRDLLPLNAMRANPTSRSKEMRTGLLGIRILEEKGTAPSRRPLKRMSSPDIWENEEGDGLMYQEEGAEEELEIELNEDEPSFLRGQTRYSTDVSPSALEKECREVREKQHRTMLDSIPKDLNCLWEDPMPETGERHLAYELRGVGLLAYDISKWKKNAYGKSISFGPRSKLSIQEQRQSLQIYKLKKELIQAMHDNQVLVVIGETGSGKTTQVTQYLAEARNTTRDCTGPETVIKYMTNGMLLREILIDKNLSQYSVIMLDEAHERTIHTNVLFGLLKKQVKWRPDLRLIVTSAMLDAEKFLGYFFNCNIFTIPGRPFPMEILYTKQPESDYLDASLITVLQIHLMEPEGDILLFLTGQEEIDFACQSLYERMKGLGIAVGAHHRK
ncbi:hypothetical protein FH972_005388 [Carpinus fangiana]|uniref:RNA helicase n=1 Tax=Carpinus fangiana TaxID=176857 RepID=A0A5N6QQ22_9ROSI|nr:hypothetical protein FH972_005388 [Carpinus fangiana]